MAPNASSARLKIADGPVRASTSTDMSGEYEYALSPVKYRSVAVDETQFCRRFHLGEGHRMAGEEEYRRGVGGKPILIKKVNISGEHD